MNKCLVTKLSGIVNNDKLLKIGELFVFNSVIDNPTKNTQLLQIGVKDNCKISVVGDANLTNENLSEDLGKTKSLSFETANLYVSNKECHVSISNKYTITNLSLGKSMKAVLEDLKYSVLITSLNLSNTQTSGDISNLKGLTKLSTLNLSDTNVVGDISNLKGLTKLSTLNLSSTNVVGDISNLKGLTKLDFLNLPNTQTSGDISNLKGLTKLSTLNLNNVTGNLSVFNDKSSLAYLVLSKSNISGDLAILADSLYFSDFTNNKSSISWSSRKQSAYIIGIQGSPKIDNIDKMLQDQANCTISSSATSSYVKAITATGARTTASDVAVQTLQSKGYTVSINPA